METTTCARCRTPIRDARSVVAREGKSYCCRNCNDDVLGHGRTEALMAHCANCQVAISDPSTQVESGGRHFCCNNCALAADG